MDSDVISSQCCSLTVCDFNSVINRKHSGMLMRLITLHNSIVPVLYFS